MWRDRKIWRYAKTTFRNENDWSATKNANYFTSAVNKWDFSGSNEIGALTHTQRPNSRVVLHKWMHFRSDWATVQKIRYAFSLRFVWEEVIWSWQLLLTAFTMHFKIERMETHSGKGVGKYACGIIHLGTCATLSECACSRTFIPIWITRCFAGKWARTFFKLMSFACYMLAFLRFICVRIFGKCEHKRILAPLASRQRLSAT